MSTTVKLKRSNTSGSVPSVNDLAFGELALNTYDGKLFFKHQDGSGQQQLVTVFEDKETNFSIDSSGLTHSSSTTLKAVLDDLDSAIITRASISAANGSASGSGSLAYNNGTGVFTFTPPVLPTALTDLNITDGSNGQFLKTNGAGTFSFSAASAPITVKKVNTAGTVSVTVINVTDFRFDSDSGLDVTDLGSGAVKIGMNSTFKTLKVNGQSDLIAVGLDTLELIAGSGISISTNPSGSPNKTLTITNTGSGGGGGGGAITVQDEGSQLTNAASTLNFTGGGITASHNSSTSVTTVNVDNNDLIGVIIDASIDSDGDLILTHVSTFNSNNALINSLGEFVLQD